MKHISSLIVLAVFACSTQAQQFKLNKLESVRQRYWQERVEHYSRHQPINLPAQELTNTWFFTWELPAGMEPNAHWNYYWGKTNDSKERQPLTIYLHGSGPREGEWKTGFKLAERFGKELPGYYYIPQIPQEGKWYRWYQRSKQWAYERLLRMAMTHPEVDPDQIYLIGISEGGYGGQRLASFYADYLAGAGPMAGGEPLKNAPAENCSNTAFSLLTGAHDKGFYRDELTYWTQQAYDSLQALHPDRYIHRVNLIPGYGHFINYNLSLRWLKHFRRNPQPRHFEWEDFEMDGVHRKGFYNLQVIERSHPELSTQDSGRQMYRMDIDGQIVNLRVEDVAYTTTQTDSIWGIEMRFARTFTPSAQGKVRIFLSENLVDLSKPVTIVVNGHTAFQGRLRCDEKWIRESLTLFGDPRRLFPAAYDIDLSTLNK